MSDDKKDEGGPPDDQRTVFIPSESKSSPPPAADESAGEAEADPWGPQAGQDEEPLATEPAAPAEEWAAGDEGPPQEEWAAGEAEPLQDEWAPAEAETPEEEWGAAEEPAIEDDRTRFEASPAMPPPPPPTSAPGLAAVVPRDNAQGIKVGDVLNHIFEVKRFIARGGMGEVFEGCNVNSDEKVAIKVMLPSLAADPNVISMFRREARALTRLQHESLVQYRVLAQEPQLGVLYIVTEYIDGVALSEVLGKPVPGAAEIEGLLRRLASGLRAAHALGVLHRDMSPDNVLLEDGKLAGAKIIDFGIAKDLDPGSATIIGDGFAGRLNYAAPEQLGDFGREMGPWTDVYTLALVMLAFANGRESQMGGSLVDAVDKRRAGPDLSPVPEQLRPVFEKMLKPNPADRLRSMDDVLRELDAIGRGSGGDGPVAVAPPKKLPKAAYIGGGVALAMVLGLGIWSLGDEDKLQDAPPGASRTVAHDPVQASRQAIDGAIPSVTCSWLDIAEVNRDGDRVSIRMGGVAGSPAAAQNEIASALAAAGIDNANIDFGLVAPISTSGCAAIDAYRQVRNTEAPRLATEQRVWEMRTQDPGTEYAGKEAANSVVRMTIGDPSLDVTLFGIDPAGILYPMIENRQQLQQVAAEAQAITAQGNDSYTVNIDLDHEGWTGLVLITGKGPFPTEIVQPPLGARNAAWLQSFVQSASRQGWQADMTWFKSENQRPGD